MLININIGIDGLTGEPCKTIIITNQFPVLPCLPKCLSINLFFNSFLFPCLPWFFVAYLVRLWLVVEVLVSCQCWILDIFVHFWLNCCVKDNWQHFLRMILLCKLFACWSCLLLVISLLFYFIIIKVFLKNN